MLGESASVGGTRPDTARPGDMSATARPRLYGTLSGLFTHELRLDDWIRLRADEARSALRHLTLACGVAREGEALLEFLAGSRDRDTQATVEALAVDYARLFIGPGPGLAPPYESVYTSPQKRFYGEALSEITAFLGHEGIRVGEEFTAPADHVAVELSIMRYLAQETAELQPANSAPVAHQLRKQLAFLDHHLLRWVPQWVSDVSRSAATEFYRGAAGLVEGYIRHDHAWLQRALARVPNSDGLPEVTAEVR